MKKREKAWTFEWHRLTVFCVCGINNCACSTSPSGCWNV